MKYWKKAWFGCLYGLALSAILMGTGGCPSHAGDGAQRRDFSKQAAEPEPLGPDETVEVAGFARLPVLKQETGVWCWAASAAMVHRYNNRTAVTQQQIVSRILGRSKLGGSGEAIVKKAQQEEVLAALNPQIWEQLEKRDARRAEAERKKQGSPDDWRLNWLALMVGNPRQDADPDDLIAGLQAKQPVIVAFERPTKHICVVYKATYRRERASGLFGIPYERTRLLSVSFVDPATRAPDHNTISGEEFEHRAGFVATVQSARKYFWILSQTSKIPTIVHKNAKGKYIERDFGKAMKKAAELNSKLEEGKPI